MTTSRPSFALAAPMRSSSEVSGTSRYESKSQPTPGSISGARSVGGWGTPTRFEMEIRVLIAFYVLADVKLALGRPWYWMNSLRFRFDSPLSADKHHSTGGWHEVGGIDPVTLLLLHDHGTNVDDQ